MWRGLMELHFIFCRNATACVVKAEVPVFCSEYDVVDFSETFLIIYQTTRRQIPEDLIP
jgi:hypothetical protein